MSLVLISVVVIIVAIFTSQYDDWGRKFFDFLGGDSESRFLVADRFYNASLTEQTDLVAEFLSNGSVTDVDVRTSFGATALNGAALFARRATVELLVERGADVNAPQGDGSTPLLAAVFSGDEELAMRFVKEFGAAVDVPNKSGATPLHGAALLGRATLHALLLERGANASSADESLITPLHGACMGGHVAIVQQLLSAGAHAAPLTVDRQTPLHWLCAGKGTVDLLDVLPLVTPANNDDADEAATAASKRIDVNAVDNDGRTALHVCVMRGYNDTVQALLEHGASALIRDANGNTPLALAFEALDTDTAKPMMELEPQHSGVLLRNARNATLLHWAAGKGFGQLVTRLIGLGVPIEARDVDGRTALHAAGRGGHTSALKALYDAGADLSARDDAGWGLMQHAATAPSRYGMLLAASVGATFSERVDTNRTTALHLLCDNAPAGLVAELVQYGANITVRDAAGRTPLHICATRLNADAVHELISAGADVNAKDNEGQSVIDIVKHWNIDLDTKPDDSSSSSSSSSSSPSSSSSTQENDNKPQVKISASKTKKPKQMSVEERRRSIVQHVLRTPNTQ